MNSPGKELPEEPNLRTSRSRPGAVSSWVWNIRANPHVRLRIKGGSFAGVAHEIIDPAELDVARSVLCESVYPTDYAEASLHLRGLPTRAKIKGLHRYWFDTGHHSWSNSEASRLRGLPSDRGSQARKELTHAAPTTPRQRSAYTASEGHAIERTLTPHEWAWPSTAMLSSRSDAPTVVSLASSLIPCHRVDAGPDDPKDNDRPATPSRMTFRC